MPGARAALPAGAAILLACAALAAAEIPRPGHFAGTTSQQGLDGRPAPVSIEISRGGRRLESLDITWFAPCDSGFSTLAQVTHAEGTLNRRGRFRGRGTYRSAEGNLKGTAYTATVSDRLVGRFVSRRRVRGAFRAVAVLRDPDGRPVSTCRTPRIGWGASRR